MFGAFVGAASYRNTECELGGAPARFDHSRVPAIGILSGNASQHPVGPALNDDASPHASMPDEFFGQGIPSLYDFDTPTPPEISFLPGDDVEDPNPKEIDSGIPEPRSTEALHQTEVDAISCPLQISTFNVELLAEGSIYFSVSQQARSNLGIMIMPSADISRI